MICDGSDKIFTRIIDADQNIMAEMTKLAQSSPFIHYKQSPEWFQVCDKSSHFLVASFCHGQVVCSSIVRKRYISILKRAKYFIDRGPLFFEPSYLDIHLTQMLALLKPTMLSLVVNPYYGGSHRELLLENLAALGFKRPTIGGYYQRTLIISLENTVEEIYASFSPKLRRDIRISESMGLQCVELIDKNQRQSFYSHYETFRHNNPGSGILPCTTLDALYDINGSKPSCLMVLSKLNAEIVGGVLIFISGKRAVYEFGFRTPYAIKQGIPGLHLPLWFAIKQCRKLGVNIFDMGGYNPDNQEYKSISRFKRYFSSKEQIVISEYQYTPNTFVAKLVDIAAQVKYS